MGRRTYCTHLNEDDPHCKVNFTQPFVFKTGRRDCTPDPNAYPEGFGSRDYFTSKHEIHPNSLGNGIVTVDFYKKNFDMTARESIALTGGIAFIDPCKYSSKVFV